MYGILARCLSDTSVRFMDVAVYFVEDGSSLELIGCTERLDS